MPRQSFILVIFVMASIFPATAHADDTGKTIMGLFGAVMQGMVEDTPQTQGRNIKPSANSQNCTGSFSSRGSLDLPVNTIRKCGGGSNARAIQKSLKILGYYHGAIDGDIGSGSRGAINAWERDCTPSAQVGQKVVDC